MVAPIASCIPRDAEINSPPIVESETNDCLLHCHDTNIPFMHVNAALTDFRSVFSPAQSVNFKTKFVTFANHFDF